MKAEITLEQAQAVVNAHRDAELAAKIKAAREVIGRCFKYRNTYGTGDKWWLYAIAIRVDSLGRLLGRSFQHTSLDRIEIADGDQIFPGQGWEEITPREFWEAAARIRKECRRRLSRQPRTIKRPRAKLPRGVV